MTKDINQFLKKNKVKEGDIVEIAEGKDNLMKGTIIPSKENILALKLGNGYNVGISLEKIKSIKKIGSGKKVGKAKTVEIKKKPGLPTISILHTGGTIASRVDYKTGGVYAAFSADDLITSFPELAQIANFESTLVSNIMSEDVDFSNYKKIITSIEKEIKKGVKGIILGHGTDTLGYSSAALAFALENCPIPVILVGAQRSSDRGSSDAGMNLICAANFIAKTDFSGVAICMHNSSSDDVCAILPACKTRKMHTSRRDAFKAVNGQPIALVSYKSKEIKFLKKNYQEKNDKLKTIGNFEEKIGFLKSHPNMALEEFEFFKKNNYKGFIIEGTGIGHTAVGTKEHEKNLEAIKKFIKTGGIVCMTSQCIFGRVHPTIYTNIRKLSEIGVIYCEDMLTETAFIKLAWLLGNYSKEETKKLMAKNLRGEISACTEIDNFEIE